MTFTTFLAFDVRVDYEQQNWRRGIRLYSGSVRARLRIKATLACEVTSRIEKTGGLLPEVVFRVRVLHSNAGYDNFVVEHVGGVGGELAKLLGGAASNALHRWKPSLDAQAAEQGECRHRQGRRHQGHPSQSDEAVPLTRIQPRITRITRIKYHKK